MAVGSTGSDPGTAVVLTTHDGGSDLGRRRRHPPAPSSSPRSSVPRARRLHRHRPATAPPCLARTTAELRRAPGNSAGTLPAGFAGRADSRPAGPADTCLVAGFTPTTAGHGQGAVGHQHERWSGLGRRHRAGRRGPPAERGLRHVPPVPGRRDHLDHGERRRPGQGRAAGEHRRRAHLDRRADAPSGRRRLRARLPGGDRSAPWWAPSGRGRPPIGIGCGGARARTAAPPSPPHRRAYTPLTLTALACPSAEHCIAVGGDTLARIALPAAAANHH